MTPVVSRNVQNFKIRLKTYFSTKNFEKKSECSDGQAAFIAFIRNVFRQIFYEILRKCWKCPTWVRSPLSVVFQSSIVAVRNLFEVITYGTTSQLFTKCILCLWGHREKSFSPFHFLWKSHSFNLLLFPILYSEFEHRKFTHLSLFFLFTVLLLHFIQGCFTLDLISWRKTLPFP